MFPQRLFVCPNLTESLFCQDRFSLHALFLVNRGRNTPDHDGAVRAALTHNGHPCGRRHLHGLRIISDMAGDNNAYQINPCFFI